MTAISVPGRVSVTLDHAVEARLDAITRQLELLTTEVRAQRAVLQALEEQLHAAAASRGDRSPTSDPTSTPEVP